MSRSSQSHKYTKNVRNTSNTTAKEAPQYLKAVGREGRGTKSFIRALIYQVLQVFKVSHTLLTPDIPNRPSSGPNMKQQTQQCRNVPVCQIVLLLMVSCQNIKGPQVFIKASHWMQDAAQQVNPLTHTPRLQTHVTRVHVSVLWGQQDRPLRAFSWIGFTEIPLRPRPLPV